MLGNLSLLLACLITDGNQGVPCPVPNIDSGVLVLASGEQQLPVSLRYPRVRLSADAGSCGGELPTQVVRHASQEGSWTCLYSPVSLNGGQSLERELRLEWNSEERILRKWLRMRLTAGNAPVDVEEITLETVAAAPLYVNPQLGPPQSYPVFFSGFFAGIEFPVATTRWEGNQALIAHGPRCRLTPDAWYESRRAVYGLAPAGSEILAFHRYIEGHRPPPKGMHFNYNSWWTSPVPFSEQDILALMKEFEVNLHQKHGIALDSFTIDMGWSDPHSVWDINRQLFPAEFTKIQAGAEAMGARLGLWTSPSSCYPQAVDPQWALEHGYESGGAQLLSLAGEKYRAKYGATIADYARRFRLAQIKLDGLSLGGADLMAGPWPSEAVAAGAVQAFQAMRRGQPRRVVGSHVQRVCQSLVAV